MTQTETKKRRIWMILAIAFFAVAAAAVAALCYMLAPSGYVALDVNPSVEIEMNRLGDVTGVKGVNDDAKKLLQGYVPDDDLDDVVEDVVDLMAKGGYLKSDEHNEVLVTVSEGGAAQKTLDRVNRRIADYLEERSLKAEVVGQTVELTDELKRGAEANGISAGKMAMIERLLSEGGASMTAAELAEIRVSDLVAYAERNGISLDILDDRLDDAEDIPELEALEEGLDDIEDEQENAAMQTAVPATTGKTEELIGDEAAKKAALNHAGVSAAEAEMVSCKLERDDGRRIYDVEFYSGSAEYDYEIDAYTGKVLTYDKDIEGYDIPRGTDDTSGNSADKVIGKTAAKKAALNHAGVSAAKARVTKCKLDTDDGRRVYEVEFRVGNTEFDYEIDAYTGAVYSYDRDIDDDRNGDDRDDDRDDDDNRDDDRDDDLDDDDDRDDDDRDDDRDDGRDNDRDGDDD
mgnify:CR=1 FL=1